MDLPLNLRVALDDALEQVKASDLSAATRELSDRYRQPAIGAEYVRTELDVLAYGAYRLPATYAAVSAVLQEIRNATPGWCPQSLLDVGAGPGTATWAGAEAWSSIADVELVEANERMIALGRKLMRADRVLSATRWNRTDLLQWTPAEPRDLVVTSYLLGELRAPDRLDLLRRLWANTSGVLALVEPGTPAGFDVIRTSRAFLIELGAHVVAPCPHSGDCPMQDGDWCHFSRRLARSRAHRDAKRVTMGYEDEKYSYVAVDRSSANPASARVLRHPQVRPGHIRLELCTRDGLEQRIVTRRDRDRFREARHAIWGDALAPGQLQPDEPPSGPERRPTGP